MSTNPKLEDTVRAAIIATPDAILDDHDVMRALIAANERAMGGNIVDLRGIAMERLESRLDRLEDTHRSVIAAAYENLAGTNQVHRAILRLLDPAELRDVPGRSRQRRGRHPAGRRGGPRAGDRPSAGDRLGSVWRRASDGRSPA